MDFIKTLLTINLPMNREKFFKFSFVLILIQVCLVLTYWHNFFMETKPSEIVLSYITLIAFVEIPFLYIYYIISTKRLWDILGDKYRSIFANIIILIFSIAILPLFPLIYILLLLLPSKSDLS